MRQLIDMLLSSWVTKEIENVNNVCNEVAIVTTVNETIFKQSTVNHYAVNQIAQVRAFNLRLKKISHEGLWIE